VTGWLDDAREVRSAKLAGNGEWYYRAKGDRFERIERPGEYCHLPWLRVITWRGGSETVFEAPLTQVEFIEFAPERAANPSRKDQL
jgi:hypothetical protein